MSPTPVSMATPTAPATYTWEATNEAVAEKYGVPIDRIVRFDLNTSPTPPELVGRILARNRFETSLSEYPPSDYRRLAETAAKVYGVDRGEILVGAGADEILDMAARAFLAAGGLAVVPVPTYSMYRVVSEQRGARVVPVRRLGPDRSYAIDVPAMRAAAREATVVWLCSPNNPTGRAEPPGVVAGLLDGLEADAAADDRPVPFVVLDEAYAEFAGESLLGLRAKHARLVTVRTASKAYALAGLRVGFAIARRPTLELMEPYRPPGSVSTISVTVVTEALCDPTEMESNVRRVGGERDRLRATLADAGWLVDPSVTNFLLVHFASPERAGRVAEGLLRRGLVPRTFPAEHPLSDCLRVTVRAAHEDDRLIEAALEIAREEAAG
ncbi:MAG TPA: histidinol-phosphate transaminase [Candidatus Saccharimonadales bacterium]|nr:histidinol-phosphate transaminase [Candidatus Saccharimonadales bacterium]